MQAEHTLSALSTHPSPIGATVLLVDDEVEILELTSTYLQTMGYETLLARDGLSALKLIAEHPAIDLLVTDILMPGDLDGIELAEQFERLRPDASVIFISGYPHGSLTWDRKILDTHMMLLKPYRFNELLILIHRTLSRKDTPPQNPVPANSCQAPIDTNP